MPGAGSPLRAAYSTAVTSYAALVPCGGTSRRMGVADKTALLLAGQRVLDHVLSGLFDLGEPTGPPAGGVVAVGAPRPVRHLGRPGVVPALRWAREDPPGGGPVAALHAGLVLVDEPVVVVVAGDLPLGPAAVPHLVTALDSPAAAGWDGAVAVDGDGRRQWLLAAYRTAALRAAVSEPVRADGRGRSLHGSLAALRLLDVPVPPAACLDLDTPEDLAHVERLLRG